MPTNQYVEDNMLRVVLLVKRGPFSKSVATIMEVGTPVCRSKYGHLIVGVVIQVYCTASPIS